MIRPCEIIDAIPTSGGRTKKVVLHSYMVTLCQIDGDGVMAIRYDGYSNGQEAVIYAKQQYEGWNVHGVFKLCDDDFREGGDRR